jgi:predicted nucleic acid-binding protein
MALDRRYWDADAFLGHFNGEPDKMAACESVLQAAEAGRLLIVTSALTIAEVLYVKGHKAMPPEKRQKVAAFFKQPYISVQNVTRKIAELARDLYWDANVRPKDAVHVATALIYRLPELNTFDKHLLGLNGKVGDPTITIRIPHEPGQGKLELETSQEKG